jgi:hypothetical protein
LLGEGIKRALREQPGLELLLDRERIESLVVEKVTD